MRRRPSGWRRSRQDTAASLVTAGPEPPADRFYLTAVLTILLVNAVLHAIAWSVPKGSLWGVHHYAFFPLTILILGVTTLLATAAVVVVRGGALSSVLRWRLRSLGRWRKTLGLAGVGAVAVAVFWILRARHLFLGDGFAIVDALPRAPGFHPLEPLAVQIEQWIYQALVPLLSGDRTPYLVAWDAAAWASVLAGAVFAPVLLGLARELRFLGGPPVSGDSELSATDVLLFLVLLAQGYVQLFFGYVEVYGIYSVGVVCYLLMAVRYLNGRAPLWPAAGALAVCLGLHLSAAVLLPSLGVLVLLGLRDASKRRTTLRDAVVGSVFFAVLGLALARMGDGYNLPGTLWETSWLALTAEQETIPGYLFSPMHFRDFLNAQLLTGPLALAWFAPAALWSLGRWRSLHGSAVFLVTAGGGYLGACLLAGDSNLGYARNWDLLAPAALVFTVSGLGLFLTHVERVQTIRKVLALALTVSLFHTVPWVAVNASPDRAFDRFFTLPLGLGRVESTVGYWFAIQERFDLAEQWLLRSVRENPANVRAHALLGDIYLYRAQYERASTAYAEASRYRPDIRIFRLRLIDSSARAGRLAVAALELEVLLEQEKENADLWAALSVVRAGSGEIEGARKAMERAAALDPVKYAPGRALLESEATFPELMAEIWPLVFQS